MKEQMDGNTVENKYRLVSVSIYVVTDLIKALPGNGSINNSQHATI
jgi:hypothetical protein